jgi:hypothetical protein
MKISGDSREYRKSADGARSNPERVVPGFFSEVATALGAVRHCRRGIV